MARQSYTGGCQCGAVRYRVETDLDSTITCNCSRCRRIGSILSFTEVGAFDLISGEAEMTEYRFNHHRIAHLFCTTCGVQSFARAQNPDGREMVAINVRCLDDVDVQALSPKSVDGRSF